MWSQGLQGERREFFRVEGHVRLHYRKLEDPQDSGTSQEVSFPGKEDLESPVEGTSPDPISFLELSEKQLLGEILSRLGRLELELARMMELLGQRLPEPGPGLKPCFVNISGCGMRFPTKERFQVGDQIEVSVELPVTPNHVIRMVGEVVHVLETGGDTEDVLPYQTAIRFVSINEPDREGILRYTMSRQYELMSRARKSR